ncbi:unnamed protein product [Ectocarpus sp. CCAP 1310/34]|nr:unnamed protein product [Ectocarpus sp. CCAP 1310/34]
MFSRARQRFMSVTTRCPKQRAAWCTPNRPPQLTRCINNSRSRSSSKNGAEGGGEGGGGGGGGAGWGRYRQSEHVGGSGWSQKSTSGFLRSTWRGRFRDQIPLPWLALGLFQAVEFGLAAYEVEAEKVDELVQRCNFHIATATIGEAVNLTSLLELLDLVHHSVLAVGPTALPKLLDAGVIGIALRGAESPNTHVAVVCYRILTVLSQNRHVARRMSRDPAIRAVLIGELRRQVKGWNHAGSGADDDHEAEGEKQQRMGGLADGGEGATAAARPPPATIVVDPIHLTLTLETLSNVMRASRRDINSSKRRSTAEEPGAAGLNRRFGAGGVSGGRTAAGEDEEDEVPWPFRFLYGENNYEGAAGYAYGGGNEDDDTIIASVGGGISGPWPLDRKLVADIAELMLSAASARDSEGAVARGEDAELGEVLEAAAASSLLEISHHPELVGLLLRRRPLAGLVAVSQDSMMAAQTSSEATLNICNAYRRCHGLPEASEPKASYEEIITWVNKTLAQEWAESPSGDLDTSEADQAFVRQAERSTLPPLPYSSVLINEIMSAGVGMALGFPWGAARRWIAWRRAGETFSVLSTCSLPWVLLRAGLRAGLGATALVATHGPAGFRPQASSWILDATSGSRGTLAMSAARELSELAYLYAILRLCPYSLLPSLVVSAVVGNDHRYGGVVDDWGA